MGETYRAGNIIGRIRDQIKKAPPRLESMDLNKAVEEVLALVRGELSKNGVSVHVRTAEGLSPVKGDRVQLQQVMLNLILNSIEAMTGADVSGAETGDHDGSRHTDGLLVAVADSGPGVAANDLERIFESFHTTKAGGVGIGLSICRSIIDAHGGRLWAEAHQLRGAVFRFTLPNSQLSQSQRGNSRLTRSRKPASSNSAARGWPLSARGTHQRLNRDCA